jgi:xylulokinase
MADPEMAIARGAAMVAFVALGQMPAEAVGSMVKAKNTFLPRSEYRQRYARLFAEWLNSYKANRPIFRRLNAGHGNSLAKSGASGAS